MSITYRTEDLFAALESLDRSRVECILDDDPALVNARRLGGDTDGQSPLQVAAAAGDLDLTALLIERGAEVYGRAQWGYPAVWHAARLGRQFVVDAFLGRWADRAEGTWGIGIDINLAAREGWLHVAIRHLAIDRLGVFRRGVIGETPLHWAAHNGHMDVVRALLDAGADIEADEIGLYGGRPLHWAAEHEPAAVRVLLEHGAEPNSRNRMSGEFEGFTPLHMCASQRNDCAECAQLLLDAGANVRATDAKGRNAMDIARECGTRRVTAVLHAQTH